MARSGHVRGRVLRPRHAIPEWLHAARQRRAAGAPQLRAGPVLLGAWNATMLAAMVLAASARERDMSTKRGRNRAKSGMPSSRCRNISATHRRSAARPTSIPGSSTASTAASPSAGCWIVSLRIPPSGRRSRGRSRRPCSTSSIGVYSPALERGGVSAARDPRPCAGNARERGLWKLRRGTSRTSGACARIRVGIRDLAVAGPLDTGGPPRSDGVSSPTSREPSKRAPSSSSANPNQTPRNSSASVFRCHVHPS